MDERWVRRDPATMARTFLWFQGEGFHMIVEDLRRLPTDRVVLVEGFRLLPRLVQPHLWDRRHAAWLLPTFTAALAAEADRADLRVLRVDGSRPPEALADDLAVRLGLCR
jgi:hypothetical protein